MSYIEGFLVPVAPGKEDAYREMAEQASELFMEYGATAVVECLDDDVPDGKVTDFRRAVAAEPGERIIFSWVVYPSKAVRDEANRKMMEDPRMQPQGEMPMSLERAIVGGFEPVVATGSSDLEASAAAAPGAG